MLADANVSSPAAIQQVAARSLSSSSSFVFGIMSGLTKIAPLSSGETLRRWFSPSGVTIRVAIPVKSHTSTNFALV